MPEAWKPCSLRKTCQFAPSSKTDGARRDRPELLHCHRPAFLPQSPHALPHPLGKFHRCPIVSPVAFQRSHYPRVFSKADLPQSEKTQPEGTGLQGLCAKPSQESRPGVPQARPAEGASPQKKRSCLPRTEFPWSPALSPSFTRTASRGTHCRELSWPSGPDRLPPLTLFLGRLLPVSRHCLTHHQPRNGSSCLCSALGLWEGSGLAGSEGSGGLPVSCGSSTHSSL